MTLSQFKILVEERLAKTESYDPQDAPCWLSHEESMAWLGGNASALQWVLEMMPPVNP